MKEATSVGKKRGIDQVIEKDDTAKQGEVVVKEEKVDAVSEKVDIDSEVCNTKYIYMCVFFLTDDHRTARSRLILFWDICILYCPIF